MTATGASLYTMYANMRCHTHLYFCSTRITQISILLQTRMLSGLLQGACALTVSSCMVGRFCLLVSRLHTAQAWAPMHSPLQLCWVLSLLHPMLLKHVHPLPASTIGHTLCLRWCLCQGRWQVLNHLPLHRHPSPSPLWHHLSFPICLYHHHQLWLPARLMVKDPGGLTGQWRLMALGS